MMMNESQQNPPPQHRAVPPRIHHELSINQPRRNQSRRNGINLRANQARRYSSYLEATTHRDRDEEKELQSYDSNRSR